MDKGISLVSPIRRAVTSQLCELRKPRCGIRRAGRKEPLTSGFGFINAYYISVTCVNTFLSKF